MLADLIREGFGTEEDYNCAEKIVYGANEAYNMGLDKTAMKLSAGFGGGMGIESTCGVLTGGVMVLSNLFVEDRGHESDKIKQLTQEYLNTYNDEMGDMLCKPLKEKHRTEEKKCFDVILKGAEILDSIVERELGSMK